MRGVTPFRYVEGEGEGKVGQNEGSLRSEEKKERVRE